MYLWTITTLAVSIAVSVKLVNVCTSVCLSVPHVVIHKNSTRLKQSYHWLVVLAVLVVRRCQRTFCPLCLRCIFNGKNKTTLKNCINWKDVTLWPLSDIQNMPMHRNYVHNFFYMHLVFHRSTKFYFKYQATFLNMLQSLSIIEVVFEST